jgi:hypothetical protein
MIEKNLTNKKSWSRHVGYSFVAALLYSIGAFIFLVNDNFKSLWILYPSNFSFALCVGLFVWSKRNSTASNGSKVGDGVVVTLMGIVISCIIIVGLLMIMPFYLVKQPPESTVMDDKNGLIAIMFMNAVLVNFFCGCFFSLLIGFSVQRLAVRTVRRITKKRRSN